MTKRTCSEQGCNRPFKGRGLCDLHLTRLRRHGNTTPVFKKKGPRPADRRCSLAGCSDPHKGHGLCNKHLRRMRTHGTTDEPVRIVKLCSLSGCEFKHYGNELCKIHYMRVYLRGGDPSVNLREVRALEALLHKDIDTRDRTTGCWEWEAGRNDNDYGKVPVGKQKSKYTHIAAYQYANKTVVPKGLLVRHTCDNPPCYNPNHLLIGDAFDNQRDSIERDRWARGTRNANAKLTDDQVQALRLDPRPRRIIALDYPVGVGQIGGIQRGDAWDWLPWPE